MSVSDRLDSVVGSTAYDSTGEKIGKVGTLYLDNATGNPKWVSVNTGLFGMNESLVPLEGAKFDGDKLVVAPSKDKVKDAPHLDAEDGITASEEDDLFAYYGLTSGAAGTAAGTNAGTDTEGRHAAGTGTAAGTAAAAGTAGTAAAAGTAASGKDTANTANTANAGTDQAAATGQRAATGNEELIRHEEQLNVGTSREAVGKARIRKYVTTETQSVQVPVSREEVTIEREKISPEEAAKLKTQGIGSGSAEAEVVLHEDKVIVDKESVPVERVRLGVNEVQETRTVSDEVQKEHFETEGIDSKNKK